MREMIFRALFEREEDGLKKWQTIVIEKNLRGLQHLDLMGTYCNQISDWLQYTGLKDKNGVEIFEGDIIGSSCLDKDIIKQEVFWEEELARFGCRHIYERNGMVSSQSGIRQEWLIEFDYKVIGNKFDNPELLEES